MQFDIRRAEAFARRMRALLNEATLGLLTSIAHQTGLFDVMATLPPSASEEIARAAGLDERYVREWLAAMVVGRVVDFDGTRGTFALPPEHAASLTRAAGRRNLAAHAPVIAALARLESAVLCRFRESGSALATTSGVEALRRADGEEEARLVDALVDALTVAVPALVRGLELGDDVLHLRRASCASCAPHTPLAARFPQSRHVEVTVAAVGGLASEHDLVTAWMVLHDHPDPLALARGLRDRLRPGGHLLCVDVKAASHLADNLEHPLGPMLYTLSTMCSLPAGSAGAGTDSAVRPKVATGNGGEVLGVLGLMAGEERTRRLLATAGFGPVIRIPLVEEDRVCLLAAREEP